MIKLQKLRQKDSNQDYSKFMRYACNMTKFQQNGDDSEDQRRWMVFK